MSTLLDSFHRFIFWIDFTFTRNKQQWGPGMNCKGSFELRLFLNLTLTCGNIFSFWQICYLAETRETLCSVMFCFFLLWADEKTWWSRPVKADVFVTEMVNILR